jgi:alpha-amylase/alpha-mannosidase (GH57 family)
MTRRFVCLHGHFYQPPRENPWLEEVEVQDSAAPFHDWNERVCAECYAPNAAARIKGRDGRIFDIVNNYRHLSFNFGPTLLSWLERANPLAYECILEADAASAKERGHGNALAQAYNHPILPLCSPRDRRTQILWGLRDFERRFGRAAEGFWLPETAADDETLLALVREGVRFTVLSPYQATRVRPRGGEWIDATGARFDPTRPYRVDLGEGLFITAFFYDGPIARTFAFGDGLTGEDIVRTLESGFDANRGHDEILTVAVDGETFGHHKRGADEALAVAMRLLGARGDLQLVNLGQAAALLEPEWEAQIAQGSSWSCAHGVERWKGNCGCHTGGPPGWHQRWRGPLREALDDLRGHLAAIFDRFGAPLLRDPWAARDAYIELVCDPDRRRALEFLERCAGRRLSGEEATQALKLLEMQRHAMLMYTSCGWFFSELSGLETVQILKYAARAAQLAREVSGVDLEPILKESLVRAPSNLPELQDGARIWDQCVKPSVVTLMGVAAHHAIASLFEKDAAPKRLFSYRCEIPERRRETASGATLAVGRLNIQSVLTLEELDLSFCVLHLGGSDFRCGLHPFGGRGQQAEIEHALFDRLSSLKGVLHQIDRLFLGREYGLRDLFLDERRRLAALLLRESMLRYENDYLDIFTANRRLMEFLREIDLPVPIALRAAAEVALTGRLESLANQLAEARADLAIAHGDLLGIVHAAQSLGARVDTSVIKPIFDKLIRERVESFERREDPDPTFQLLEIIDLGLSLGLQLDLSLAQNRVWALAGVPGGLKLDSTLSRLASRLRFDPGTLEARIRAALQAAPAARSA